MDAEQFITIKQNRATQELVWKARFRERGKEGRKRDLPVMLFRQSLFDGIKQHTGNGYRELSFNLTDTGWAGDVYLG